MEALEGAGGVLFLLLLVYVVAEMALLHFRRHTLRLREARTTLFGALSVGVAIAIALRLALPVSVFLLASAGLALSPVGSLGTSIPVWIAGWLIYEFWYWFQHWAAHQVRLLWCIHSPHHAPKSIHMMVGANHHFLESAFYMPFFAGFMPALFGIEPVICVALNLVDSIWGSFLHISDEVVPKGRYGILGHLGQLPAHQRRGRPQGSLRHSRTVSSDPLAPPRSPREERPLPRPQLQLDHALLGLAARHTRAPPGRRGPRVRHHARGRHRKLLGRPLPRVRAARPGRSRGGELERPPALRPEATGLATGRRQPHGSGAQTSAGCDSRHRTRTALS
jgi:hypothetical protein